MNENVGASYGPTTRCYINEFKYKISISVKAMKLSQNDTKIALKTNKKVPRGNGDEYERYLVRLLYF